MIQVFDCVEEAERLFRLSWDGAYFNDRFTNLVVGQLDREEANTMASANAPAIECLAAIPSKIAQNTSSG